MNKISLNNYVDHIFVISMKHRSDRLEHFDKLSKQYNFEYEVFQGFNGQLINSDFQYANKQIGPPYGLVRYFKGNIGCIISHIEVIKNGKNKSYNKIAIFEDDCEFHEDFNLRLKYLMDQIGQEYQLLYLGGSIPDITQQFNGYGKIQSICTTHSYIINISLYDLVINHLSNNVFTKPVDVCFSDIHQHCDAYVALPFLTYQKSGFSDINQKYVEYGGTKKYL